MIITELKYSNTNTYLIEGDKGAILFDTGWAGTFAAFCRELGEKHKRLQDISYILISHFHPDHMGIAGEIAGYGPKVLVVDLQLPYVHCADAVFEKEGNAYFKAISEADTKVISIGESREFLGELGIKGEIIHTPGHSDDSISLLLDDGSLFVGDLNPLYELEMHKGTDIEKSWNKLLGRAPAKVFYGHAKAAVPGRDDTALSPLKTDNRGFDSDDQELVAHIVRYIDKGYNMAKIARKTGASLQLIEDVNRMYLTHPGVSIQGILDRIEIKNK